MKKKTSRTSGQIHKMYSKRKQYKELLRKDRRRDLRLNPETPKPTGYNAPFAETGSNAFANMMQLLQKR